MNQVHFKLNLQQSYFAHINSKYPKLILKDFVKTGAAVVKPPKKIEILLSYDVNINITVRYSIT